MRTWRLLLIGFGTVGKGVASRIGRSAAELRAAGCDARIVGVVDVDAGCMAPEGIDPEALLEHAAAGRSLSDFPGGVPARGALEEITAADADVVIESTPTNLITGDPGLSHIRAALEAGQHVITMNKGPVALAHAELAELAGRNGVRFLFEGTVLSGTPALNLARAGLAGAEIRAVRGVLNGTCNFILTRMEEGTAYEAALAEAQRLGYAETDPTGDVEGWDAAAKVAILADCVLGAGIGLAGVERRGISDLDAEVVAADARAGTPWRLVGSVTRVDGGWQGRVAPERLAADDPLAAARGPTNMIVFETEALGAVTIIGPGAGGEATGHAVVADLLEIHRGAR